MKRDVISLTKNNENRRRLEFAKNNQSLQFIKDYENLTQILKDRKLVSLGDAYINFVYSLALSQKEGKPSGTKVKGTALAEALRKAGLRKPLPSRIDEHALSDAAEALIVYAWLHKLFTIEESVATLEKTGTLIEGLTQLLLTAKEKIKLSKLFPIPC